MNLKKQFLNLTLLAQFYRVKGCHGLVNTKQREAVEDCQPPPTPPTSVLEEESGGEINTIEENHALSICCSHFGNLHHFIM